MTWVLDGPCIESVCARGLLNAMNMRWRNPAEIKLGLLWFEEYERNMLSWRWDMARRKLRGGESKGCGDT